MQDVLIAGGGPAGLGAAIMAASAGLSVTIIEPHPGVIDKACGEGLMPGAARTLERLGVTPTISHPFVGVRYLSGRWEAAGRFPQGPGLGVRRTVLHTALRDRAAALGVVWQEDRVRRITQGQDWVEACGTRGRWMLAADGMRSSIRRSLELELPPRRPPRLGLRRHFAMAPWSDFVEVYWTGQIEAYVTPVAPDLVGVALLFPGAPLPEGRGARDRYHTLLSRFPVLSARLENPATSVRGSGPFERRLSGRVAGRVLLIGDAAGYLDPLTGEGIRLGLASAAAALDCIAADRPRDYERIWRRIARRYWWMTSGLLWLRDRPLLRQAMVPFLSVAPGVFSQIVGLLADTRDSLTKHEGTRALVSPPDSTEEQP